MSVQLFNGDCVEEIKKVKPGSVDLILCDPPYGTIKGMGKNVDGYDHERYEWDEIIEVKKMFDFCQDSLRLGGALVLFGQEPFTSNLVTSEDPSMPFSYRMVWYKNLFANRLMCNKAPVSYYEDIMVFFKKYDTLKIHPLRDYSRRMAEYIGKSKAEILQEMGNKKASHFLSADAIQFGFCKEEVYEELTRIYSIDSQEWYQPYETLQAIHSQYGRVFNLPRGKKIKSNVLEFKKDSTRYHPTQKPVRLLEDLIETYSNVGDTVLDFTMGSGSTGVAAVNLDRNFIGIERDEKYFAIAAQRIEDAQSVIKLF